MPEEKQNEIKAIGSYNLSINRKKHLIMADDSQFLANSHNILTKHFSPTRWSYPVLEGSEQGGGKGYLLPHSYISHFSIGISLH